MSAVSADAEQRERNRDRADRDGSACHDAADDRTAAVGALRFALEADGADAELALIFGPARSIEIVVDAFFHDGGEGFLFCAHVTETFLGCCLFLFLGEHETVFAFNVRHGL